VALDGGLIARLRRQHEIGGDQDVLAEERGQPCAGGATVERLDRVADVLLVSEQALRGGGGVWQVGGGADDEQPRPRDVVLPETAHLVVQREPLLARTPLHGGIGVLHGTLG
jgi:hypothetical protein